MVRKYLGCDVTGDYQKNSGDQLAISHDPVDISLHEGETVLRLQAVRLTVLLTGNFLVQSLNARRTQLVRGMLYH